MLSFARSRRSNHDYTTASSTLLSGSGCCGYAPGMVPGILCASAESREGDRIETTVVARSLARFALARSLALPIARAGALQMEYAFACEFEELRSPLRSPRDQGGGVHGNAVLARRPYGLAKLHALRHVSTTRPEMRRSGLGSASSKAFTRSDPNFSKL